MLPLWGIRFILRPNHSACFNFHLNSESYDCKFPSSEIQVQLICDGAVIRVTASVLKTLSFVSRDVQRLAEIQDWPTCQTGRLADSFGANRRTNFSDKSHRPHRTIGRNWLHFLVRLFRMRCSVNRKFGQLSQTFSGAKHRHSLMQFGSITVFLHLFFSEADMKLHFTPSVLC